jgi:hypothetical protein
MCFINLPLQGEITILLHTTSGRLPWAELNSPFRTFFCFAKGPAVYFYVASYVKNLCSEKGVGKFYSLAPEWE